MKILVCIKQVPDTTDIKWTENNTMQREGVESIINPYDVYAIEEALKIKKRLHDVEITVLTMGPCQAENALRDAISVGSDQGVLVSDRKFAGADTFATSKTLSAAIKKLGDFDLIICGQFAVDGDTGQTGPSIANNLGLPQVTFVQEIQSIENGEITVKRETDEGIERVKSALPAVVCIVRGLYEPSRPLIGGVINAQNSEIKTYSMEDLGLTQDEVGLRGSPTWVCRSFRFVSEHNCEMVSSVEDLYSKVEEFAGV